MYTLKLSNDDIFHTYAINIQTDGTVVATFVGTTLGAVEGAFVAANMDVISVSDSNEAAVNVFKNYTSVQKITKRNDLLLVSEIEDVVDVDTTKIHEGYVGVEVIEIIFAKADLEKEIEMLKNQLDSLNTVVANILLVIGEGGAE